MNDSEWKRRVAACHTDNCQDVERFVLRGGCKGNIVEDSVEGAIQFISLDQYLETQAKFAVSEDTKV